MLAKDLLGALSIVKGGLYQSNFVEILGHFCFTKKCVFAYNDTVAVLTPCTTALRSSLPGIVIGLLSNTKGTAKVHLNSKFDTVMVQAKSLKLELPSIPSKNYLFDLSVMDKLDALVIIKLGRVSTEFWKGVELCLKCSAFNPAVVIQSGIILEVEGDALSLFSTDNTTLTKCKFRFNVSTKLKKRIVRVVPFKFFEELLRLVGVLSKKVVRSGQLSIGKDEIWVKFLDGTVLYSKTIIYDSKQDLDSIISKHTKGGKFSVIPDTLRMSVHRASILMGSDLEKYIGIAASQAGGLVLDVTGKLGTMKEILTLVKPRKNFKCVVNVDKFERATTGFSSISLHSNEVLVFGGLSGKITHLVKTHTSHR